MKKYAKLKDNGRISFCPRNGYIKNMAVSNLPQYFEDNPKVAESEGYREFVPLEEPTETVTYKIKGRFIYEVNAEEV